MKPKMIGLLGALVLASLLVGCGGGGSNDQTFQPVDRTTPQVISTNPNHDSSSVPTNRAITATFNKSINPATINSQSFYIEDSAGASIAGELSYNGTSRTATFRSTDNLSNAANYRVTIASQIEDLSGNQMGDDYSWSFTTAPLESPDATDVTPPTVQSTYPAAGATSIPVDSTIVATFSEAIDPATLNADSFTLLKDSATSVPGTRTLVGNTARFTPAQNLDPGASYTAELTMDIKDLAGNALAAPHTWSFTTESQSATTTAPQILSFQPLDGATNVALDASIVVTFDKPILPFEFGTIDGRPVAVTFNDTYTIVTLTPTVNLGAGRQYTVRVRVSDMSGNRMEEPFEWTFTTTSEP
jgi:hypothetical protein